MTRIPHVILTSIFLSLIGCTGGEDPGSAPRGVTPPGELPIVREETLLTGFIPSIGFIPDIDSNAAMNYVTERTNVRIAWVETNKLNAREELTLLLSSGTYPGIIQGASGSGLSVEDLVSYGTNGTFLTLNDLIEENGFYIKELFASVPGVRDVITAPDGNIYGLPAVFSDDYHMTMRQKLWINARWLDRLGLEMPATTEELYDVLVAFRDQDGNGNGDPGDEIPMTGARRSLEDVAMWVMNAFVPAGGPDESGDPRLNSYEFIRDGRVFFSANTDEFRSGLRYLRRLYQAGLIDIAAFTQERAQIRALVDGGSASRVGAVASHHPGNFATIGDDPDFRFRDYRALSPVEGPGGERNTPWSPSAIIQQGQFVITDRVADPEVAIRLADFYYSREFAEIEKGVEGLHWRRLESDDELPAIGGGIASYEYLSTLATEDNAQINLGPVWTRDLKNEFARTAGFSYEQMLYDATLAYEPYGVPLYPYSTVRIAAGTVDEFNDLRRTIHTYVGESVERFIIGAINLESSWDEYVEQLNRLGLPRYLELLHGGYVRLQRRMN